MTLDQAIENHNKIIKAIDNFVTLLQKEVNHYMSQYPSSMGVTVVKEFGKRYVRIVKADNNGSQRFVHSFVDLRNGDILKGSWKAPVKNGIRGNVLNENPMQGMNHHGPNYLR